AISETKAAVCSTLRLHNTTRCACVPMKISQTQPVALSQLVAVSSQPELLDLAKSFPLNQNCWKGSNFVDLIGHNRLRWGITLGHGATWYIPKTSCSYAHFTSARSVF